MIVYLAGEIVEPDNGPRYHFGKQNYIQLVVPEIAQRLVDSSVHVDHISERFESVK